MKLRQQAVFCLSLTSYLLRQNGEGPSVNLYPYRCCLWWCNERLETSGARGGNYRNIKPSVREGLFALSLFHCEQNRRETDLPYCHISLVSQQSSFMLEAVQTGPFMSAKFALLYKMFSPYYFWICNYMASILVFLLMRVFTRPAFVMLLNLRLSSNFRAVSFSLLCKPGVTNCRLASAST